MDQTQLQQQIAISYSRLSPGAQSAFSSMTWMDTLERISASYNLTADQKAVLAIETTLVLLGITSPEEYEGILTEKLSLPKERADLLVKEISDSILASIRPELENAYDTHAKILVEEKYGNIAALDERFAKLPEEVQQAINESNYQATLYTIASEYKLSIEQMGILEEITNKVLLGIIHPDQYESELKSKISLDTGKITELVEKVNKGVLMNIRESLRAHWGKADIKETTSDDEVPIPPYKKTEPIVETRADSTLKEPVEVPRALPKNESVIYEKAGIEMVEEEKPEDDIEKTIIRSKLNMTTKSAAVTSDHSIPKVTPPPQVTPPIPEAPKAVSHDPYHEAIE